MKHEELQNRTQMKYKIKTCGWAEGWVGVDWANWDGMIII